MDQQLERIDVRLKRADKHLDALNNEVSILRDAKNSGIVGHFEPETSEYVFRVKGGEPSVDMGLSVSEFAHQLRAALDNLISRLVEMNGNTVTNQTTFVIADDCQKWKDNRGKLRGLGTDQFAIVQEAQPYKRGDLALDDPLSRLGWLNNRDKHRFFHASYWVFKQPMFPLPETIPIPRPANDTTGPFAAMVMNSGDSRGDRAEICRCFLDNPGPNPKMSMDDDLPVDISLTDSERPLRLDDLREIRGAVGSIVGRLIVP